MSRQTQHPDDGTAESSARLFSSRFRRFCAAKGLQLLAQNALVYGLFVILLEEADSSLAVSAFVLASVVPSILLSVPAGVVADMLPRKGLLLAALAMRIAIVVLFIQLMPGPWLLIGLTFLFWTAYQLFTPPENAMLNAVVTEDRLPAGIAVLQGLSLLCQLMGAGVLAPLVIKLGDSSALFWSVLVLFCVSGALYASIPHLTPASGQPPERLFWWQSLPIGLHLIRGDRELFATTLLKVLVDTGMMMVIVAVPSFVEEVLSTGAENAIYIALPGALGLALGLGLAPLLIAVLGFSRVAYAGFTLFLAVVFAMPFVPRLATLLPPDASTGLHVSDRIIVTTLLLPLAGLGLSLTQVGARAAVYRRISDRIGQVLATQSAIGSTVALVPTIVAGVLLDLVPVDWALLAIAVALASFAIAGMRWHTAAKTTATTLP
jgi:MFS family permease